jgi:hypothetical protein
VYAVVDAHGRACRKFRAANVETVLQTIEAYAPLMPIDTMDLFGHSTPSGVVLGSEMVIGKEGPSSFFNDVRSGLTRNHERFQHAIAIRLLSCKSSPHRAAVERMVDLPFVSVYGTTDQISASDFDRDGFAATSLLTSVDVDRASKAQAEVEIPR